MNKLFMGALAALALTACSSEGVVPDQTLKPGEEDNRYMSVALLNSNGGGTRGGGDQTKDENGNLYEEGYTNENDVKSLRFYFFGEKDNPIVVFNNQSFYDCNQNDIVQGGPDMPNVEKLLDAIIVINSTDKDIDEKIKKMVAVVNFKGIESKLTIGGTRNLSLSQLKSVIGTESECNLVSDTKEHGFLMSSSVYVDGGNVKCVSDIKDSDIQASRELAMQHPVDVYVERVAAKVRVKANWDSGLVTVKTANYDGKEWKAVALTKNDKTPITVDGKDDSAQVYVIFRNWDLWWTADKSFLFKSILQPTQWNDNLSGWGWTHPSFHRSYWAENPDGVELAKHRYDYPSKQILTGEKFTADEVETQAVYCLENAAKYNNGGLMETYDPDETTTPRTLVYLDALLVTIDESNNAQILEIAEWAATRGTLESIKKRMFEPNQNIVYMKSKNPVTSSSSTTEKDDVIITEGSSTYKMIPVTVDMLKFVTGMKAGLATEDKENSPRYLSYLNLDIIDKEGNWKDKYKTIGGIEVDQKFYIRNSDGSFEANSVSADEVNSIYEKVGGAKVYKDGRSYYYHEIQHLNPTDETNQKGKYGVVRNHIYEIELNSVYGLGTPVLTPEPGDNPDDWEDITPQRPSHEYFLGARVKILSWRVVKQKVNIDW